MKNDDWWKPPFRFMWHVIAGGIAFETVLAVTVGLELEVNRLETLGVSSKTIMAIDFIHYALGAVDAVVFLAYIVIMGWRAIKEIRR